MTYDTLTIYIFPNGTHVYSLTSVFPNPAIINRILTEQEAYCVYKAPNKPKLIVHSIYNTHSTIHEDDLAASYMDW